MYYYYIITPVIVFEVSGISNLWIKWTFKCNPASYSQTNCFCASLTVRLEDDSNVVLDEGADVEQHSWRVNGAETELYVICCVIVAKAEVVIMRVDPVSPCCFVWYRLLSYVVSQPRANLKVGSDVLEKNIVDLDNYTCSKVLLQIMSVCEGFVRALQNYVWTHLYGSRNHQKLCCYSHKCRKHSPPYTVHCFGMVW